MKNLIIFLSLVTSVFGYKVLCIFPAPARSHDNLGKGVVKSLLKAGHKVTWATPFEQDDVPANLTVINLVETRAILDNIDATETSKKSLSGVRNYARNLTEAVARNQELRKVVVQEQFDAVVTVWALNDNEAGYAAIQGVPWILLSTIGYHPHLEWMMDEVRSIPTTPLIFNESGIPMSFWRRMFNLVAHVALSIDFWFDQASLDELYRSMFIDLAKARGVPLPAFSEVQRNVSILLVNSHESIEASASKPPNVINIAGYHIDEVPPPLSKDLQNIMDNSPQGVIYFSMGSILRSATVLQGDILPGLLRTFGSLNQTVLWKFEEKLEVEMPKNVFIRPWLSQQSILAHPNIRVFITHGGQLSTLEAVHAGVPLLAIPMIADQPSNAERARKLGYALKVDFGPNLAADVAEKLEELLNNRTYYDRARYLSKIFNARPESPSKLIAHYVELTIETKGAYHLRSPSHQYSWIQRWMLDLIVVISAFITVVIVILVLIIRTCCRLLCCRNRKSELKEKIY